MFFELNYYQILEVSQKATQTEIKQAYRRLAKCFHPDSQQKTANHEKIIEVNAAYEVLGDPQRRRVYDQKLQSENSYHFSTKRQQRSDRAQKEYQQNRQQEKDADTHQWLWLKKIYTPINRLVRLILSPLETQIDYLSADPFDEELMEEFQNYLQNCRNYLSQARQIFASQPNPVKLAGVAMNLYYCMNQIGDGIEELEWFTRNYDDHYLHTGKEMFRIARSLQHQAQDVARLVAR
jgi:molecular chaperone DnaJ